MECKRVFGLLSGQDPTFHDRGVDSPNKEKRQKLTDRCTSLLDLDVRRTTLDLIIVDKSHDVIPYGKSRSQDDLTPGEKRRKLGDRITSLLDVDHRHATLDLAAGDKSCKVIPSRKRRSQFKHVAVSSLIHPKSLYQGWQPTRNITSEEKAISLLLTEWERLNPQVPAYLRSEQTTLTPHATFKLSNFAIYQTSRESKWTPVDYIMIPLHTLKAKFGVNDLFFDGVLSVGENRISVEKVPFDVLSIDGYEDLECHSVSIWIQTKNAAKQQIWYQLESSAPEYKRYHEPFLWIANFGKYFVDFLLDHPEVTLEDFRRRFAKWTQNHHATSHLFQAWYRQYGRLDFRNVIAVNVEYLWKEATNINPELRHRGIWSEVDPSPHQMLRVIMRQPRHETMTVVTPFVYDCFKNAYFSKVLESRASTNPAVIAAQNTRKRLLGFPIEDIAPRTAASPSSNDYGQAIIQRGTVVSVQRDVETKWKDDATTWFAYVRNVLNDKRGKYLQVIWLYQPQDTTLSNMGYPYQNELFMSDHCNCGVKTFRISDVRNAVAVEWSPQSIPTMDYFVRQKYSSEDNSFVTLKETDFNCCCLDRKPSAFETAQNLYQYHDTILAVQGRGKFERLEPFVISNFLPEVSKIQVRRLLRAQRDLGIQARPNELVWTDQFLEILPQSIHRRCQIRFFSRADLADGRIPTPYDRDGQVDCFYIMSRLLHQRKENVIQLLHSLPGPMRLGFDPNQKLERRRPLQSMSLFSGGGNFDRGLEEGGAVETRWVVELDLHAVHTFRANLNDPTRTQIFHGSVDDCIAMAIRGSTSKQVPQIGEVQNLTAGSPCQGFSLMQPDTLSMSSLVNASKLASVAAFIDLYRPIYAQLENVPSMTRPIGPNRDQNMFSLMLCALVGMGYQVQQFPIDAWAHGSPQARTRLFIGVTAPGYQPLSLPYLTHSHPTGVMIRTLGKAVNGEPFGARRTGATPFKYVTVGEATKHLPQIGDGHVGTCISKPDHHEGILVSGLARLVINNIPVFPRGQSLAKAAELGVLPTPAMQYQESRSALSRKLMSKSFMRVDPDGLFPTFTTKLTPLDAKFGFGVHWDQNRVLTVEEARIGQGFIDDEVIVGRTAQRWKIIGNSVARPVALALGMSLREAWLANSNELVDQHEKSKTTTVRFPVSPPSEISGTQRR